MSATVGIVGFGEAGSAIAAGLVADGVDVAAFDMRTAGPDGDRLRQLADTRGVTLVDDLATLVRGRDVILSLVTSSAALGVATDLAAHVEPDQLVADLNSTSPGLVEHVGATIAEAGATFVDVAVMSAVPPRRHKVPMLASGPGAERFAALPLGMQVDVVSEQVGAASAVKMLRSVLVKGLEALIVEFGIAARRYGATQRVLESMNGSLPTQDWRELATYLLTRTAQHGKRRGHEMEEVAAMLRELDIEPMMVEGTARRLLWAADHDLSRFADQPPASYDDVLDVLVKEEL